MRALPAADAAVAAAYRAAGWWGETTVGEVVRGHAATSPDAIAFVDERGERTTWADYDRAADAFAAALLGTGLERGERVAVVLPDGALLHAAFVGAGRAGLVVVGIGSRAGEAEVAHLLARTGAAAIVTGPDHPRRSDVAHHLVVSGSSAAPLFEGVVPAEDAPPMGRAIGPDELFLLNSTSGTTGLPKCVMQIENRWAYFHRKALEHGGLRADDVFLSALPGPFGFGLWTAHFTPALLGAPCVVLSRFDAEAMLSLIETERVTVLACVSTQFILALNSPALDRCDLSSLRVMFTGGEAIPYPRALEFEERTGATVLNFYGSNETGMLSGTRLDDDRQRRLTTGGRCVEEMQVRLFDEAGHALPTEATTGIPGCRGPATALGYWDDDEANRRLFSDDGWMLMGDVVSIDDGWLSVVGRTSDFIIRGGKNISAPAVEGEVGTHPLVTLAAAVAVPDDVFGERVAVYVELRPVATLTLDELRAHLLDRGVSKEWLPEYLAVVDELPRSSGGKVAKGDLRRDAAGRFGTKV